MAGQTVVVSVLADTKKFSRAFKNLSQETGLDKLGGAFKSAGAKVVDFFQTGIKWAGAFAAATLATAMFKGWNRLTAIENAQAKLQGLGHDATAVTSIMDDALASVKGTAYGLDEAATLAASAVAAGKKPAQDLQAALSLVGDASTIAGVGLNEMGSIFAKVWTSGKAQTTELNQIADRGIPIWTKLAEHYGVTTDELRKMVSQGKVDAATFEQVMTDIVGGSALEAGNTTQGAFANMGAAMGRFGAVLLDDVFPMIKDAFNGITGLLDGLTAKAEPIGEVVATAFGRAQDAVASLWGWFQDKLLPVLVTARDLIGGAFSQAIDTVRTALENAGISGDGMASSIGDGLVNALRIAGELVANLVAWIGNVVAWFINWKDVILPIAVAIGTAVVGWTAYQKIVAIVKAAQLLLNAAMAMNPIGLVIAAVAGLVAGLVYLWNTNEGFREAVTALWEAIKTGVMTAIDKIKEWVAKLGEIPGQVSAWFQSAKDKGIEKFQQLVDWVKGLPGRIVAAIADMGAQLGSKAREHVQQFKQSAIDKFNETRDWVRDVPSKIVSALGNLGSLLKSAGRSIIDGLWNGLKEKWENVKNWVSGIGSWIADHKGPRSYDLNLLVNAGKWIMQGLQHGLESELTALERTLGTVAATVERTPLGALDVGRDRHNIASVNAGGTITGSTSTATTSTVEARLSSADVATLAAAIIQAAQTGTDRTIDKAGWDLWRASAAY